MKDSLPVAQWSSKGFLNSHNAALSLPPPPPLLKNLLVSAEIIKAEAQADDIITPARPVGDRTTVLTALTHGSTHCRLWNVSGSRSRYFILYQCECMTVWVGESTENYQLSLRLHFSSLFLCPETDLLLLSSSSLTCSARFGSIFPYDSHTISQRSD